MGRVASGAEGHREDGCPTLSGLQKQAYITRLEIHDACRLQDGNNSRIHVNGMKPDNGGSNQALV